jgi:hypothetical protein
MQNMKWKVFIIFHKSLFFDNYASDTNFNSENYTFLKVGDAEPDTLLAFKDIKEIGNYTALGKWYAESEAIYNLYKNPNFYSTLDYIGFSQYDKPHIALKNGSTNITQQVKDILKTQGSHHISLETYSLSLDYDQNIMMDDDFPDQLTGSGKNCYLGILEDYNYYHQTQHNLAEISLINLCSSFIISVTVFDKIMKFIAFIIESKKLDRYDSLRKHRIQGGLLERYIGLALAFEDVKFHDLSIGHLNQK